MTVKTLITKLEKLPQNAKVVYQRNYLDDIRSVKYKEDYVYGTTYRMVILNENNTGN